MLFVAYRTPGERYKAYHEEAERIVSELGSSICDTSGMGVAESSVSPATLYISGMFTRQRQTLYVCYVWWQ